MDDNEDDDGNCGSGSGDKCLNAYYTSQNECSSGTLLGISKTGIILYPKCTLYL